MKIAVFSDTHGLAQGMIDAVREYRPDQVIHLGDGMRDAQRLSREFPTIPVCTVPGNCDYDSYDPEYKVVDLGGMKAFLTHGHRYAVRSGRLDTLLYETAGMQILSDAAAAGNQAPSRQNKYPATSSSL